MLIHAYSSFFPSLLPSSFVLARSLGPQTLDDLGFRLTKIYRTMVDKIFRPFLYERSSLPKSSPFSFCYIYTSLKYSVVYTFADENMVINILFQICCTTVTLHRTIGRRITELQ